MLVDIAVGIILIISIVMGYSRGFARTFLHIAGWILSIVLAFVFYPKVTEILMRKTSVYDTIHSILYAHFSSGSESTTQYTLSQLPTALGDTIQGIIDGAAGALADALTDGVTQLLFNILGFLLIAVGVRLLFLLISLLFSKNNNDGITGFVDGILGALAGAAKGMIVVYIVLAFLVPMLGLTDNPVLQDALASSVFSQYLYDNNLLFFALGR